jgi:hypothetical protein
MPVPFNNPGSKYAEDDQTNGVQNSSVSSPFSSLQLHQVKRIHPTKPMVDMILQVIFERGADQQRFCPGTRSNERSQRH